MSQLTQKDMHTPFNAASIRKIRGRVEKIVSKQTVAVDLTEGEILDIQGKLLGITFIAEAVCAAGESVTVDVNKNGVSILPAVFTYDGTLLPATLYTIETDADVSFERGDVVSFVRNYTAGGGPTPLASTKIVLEIA